MIFKAKNLMIFVLMIFFVSSVNAQAPIVGGETSKKNETKIRFLVKFKQGKKKSIMQKFQRDVRFEGEEKLGSEEDWSILKVNKNKKNEFLNDLKKENDVLIVEEDAIASVLLSPNDPAYALNQWGLENTGQNINGMVGKVDSDVDASSSWDKTSGEGVKVAVLDTGIDKDHPDLAGVVVINKNFSTSTTDDDMYGHGTHVAGIIAAKYGNALGVAGACKGCSLINVKVLGDDGSGYYSAIINGIYFAVENGAKVINMSLGGSASSASLEQAVNFAWSKGVVVVAASGNSGNSNRFYPAAYKNVIAVASTNNKDQKSSFSNFSNSWVMVAAPGEAIFSTLPNHDNYLKNQYGLPSDYGWLSGTSMASPFVAAEAALVTKKYGVLGASIVRFKIERNTDLISGSGRYWKYGRVNFEKATR